MYFNVLVISGIVMRLIKICKLNLALGWIISHSNWQFCSLYDFEEENQKEKG